MINLSEKCVELRKEIIRICYKTQSGHPSSALSCVEIMAVLFYDGILKKDFNDLMSKNNDRFILSKGHACILQYIILADLGIIKKSELDCFCKKGSFLGGHANSLIVPGIDFSAGSLGHGLAFAVGQAMNFKYLGMSNHVYVLLGDGECQEGSIWEAALLAGNRELNNLTVIIDNNKLQSSDYVDSISAIRPIREKWNAFGFETIMINGHNINDVADAFRIHDSKKPKVIIADTIKGKGVSIMEGKKYWHAKRPNSEQWEDLKVELNIIE